MSEKIDLDALELRAMRFQKLNPLHECFDSATTLALIARLREAEACIENAAHIHGPREVRESDRAYTLVCTTCITETYPCATVKTLVAYKPSTENGSES